MRVRIAAAAAVPLLLALSACGANGGDGRHGGKAAAAPARGEQSMSVQVVKTDLGPILADQSGRTLYAFTKDKADASTCDAKCIAVWPALSGRQRAGAGPGADRNLVSGVGRTRGTVQTAYNHWPLYYYAGDAAAGDTNGQGLDGQWFVLGADGKLVKRTA
ncbi:hypothetical protein GCM10018793_63530 [Streptomyces sulfonofaciens]|uniref:Lipoprotein n=1 Tax=Streptomyces sulfonofaciens TaxID=68272 RepID=A0A919GMX7_9ACTN|nr:hypothetical protein [Streptomyces sulfonofaciens]GHH87502.1 hypothetical protein GCM10018793_63530 [Streptomyces sulfonofaciens]